MLLEKKFLEISPGSDEASEFSNGDYVRGEDPPRIDQLISQSYGLAGKLINLVEKNERLRHKLRFNNWIA